MRKLVLVAGALVALALASPVSAITRGGAPDNGEHPMVGQLLFYVPEALPSPYGDDQPGGWFTCTGTLLSGTVVVTAGHCTFGVGLDGVRTTTEGNTSAEGGNGSGGNDVWISFDETDEHFDGFPATFDADGNLNYETQQERYEARAAWLDSNPLWTRATSYPHPEYDDAAFFLHDAGVIVLDEAQPGPYATIASENYLQQYAGRRNEHRFEVVGYGLKRAHPNKEIDQDTRWKAEPKLNTIVSNPKKTYIVLSNNARTGGTCFGDSGGPTFDTTSSTLVVAVTSFGLSPNCTGIGGAYRLDQPDDLAFLAGFGIEP